MERRNQKTGSGLHTDNSPVNQPLGKARFLLNAVEETKEGEQTSLINERGTEPCYELNSLTSLIGEIKLPENKSVIFEASDSTVGTFIFNFGTSIISIVDNTTCKKTVIIQTLDILGGTTGCLNFSIKNAITGEARIRNGCDRYIYFRDNRNPPRIINLDNLDIYKIDKTLTTTVNNWDCTKFRWFREYNPPCLTYSSTLNGGSLEYGTYQFAVQYLDAELNPTHFMGHTQPIPVVVGSEGQQWRLKEGGFNNDINFPPSKKAISLNLSNLDTDFEYYRLGVIETKSGTGSYSNAYVLNAVPISGTTSIFTYTGLNPTIHIEVPLEEIIQQPIILEDFKYHTQADKRMIVANITEKDVDHAVFQRSACNVQLKYTTQTIEETQQENGNKSGSLYSGQRSFLRDEVYAFGIVYIFQDGYETPAYHIPGRAPNLLANRTIIPTPVSLVGTDSFNFGSGAVINAHNRRGATSSQINNTNPISANDGNWDLAQYPTTGSSRRGRDRDMDHLIAGGRATAAAGGYPRWEVYNTAIRTEFNGYTGGVAGGGAGYTRGEFAYFQTDYTYPVEVDCNGNSIYQITDTNGNLLEDLTGQNVRFHKFPDTTLEPAWLDGDTTISIGFDVHNVQIPAIYANEVIGWKIVVSKRSEIDSTVLDKGLAFSNIYFTANDGFTAQSQAYPASMWKAPSNVFPVPAGGERIGYMTSAVHSLYNPCNSISGGVGNIISGIYEYIPTLNNQFQDIGIPSLSYHGAGAKFDKRPSAATYIKFEGVIETRAHPTHGSSDPINSYRKLIEFDTALLPNPTRIGHPFNGVTYSITNRPIENYAFVGPHEYLQTGILSSVFINNTQQETMVLEPPVLIDPITGTRIDSQVPFPISGNQVPTCTELRNNYYGYHISLKKLNYNIYSGLNNIVYRNVDSCIHTGNTNAFNIYGGDTFISSFWFRKTVNIENEGDESDDNFDGDGTFRIAIKAYSESLVNANLRSGGDLTLGLNSSAELVNDCEFGSVQKYYPKHYFDYSSVCCDDGDWLVLDYCHTNFYSYNPDYSKLSEKVYFPLKLAHDFCPKCGNVYPHRVYYSQKGDQEQQSDNYKSFLANNYKDLQADRGEITGLFVRSNKLYIRTRESLWEQVIKPLQQQSNQGVIYVGTGRFFQIDENEVVTVDDAYAGGLSQFGIVHTPYGVVFPDEIQGRIFRMSNQLQEISSRGRRNWFKENLKLFLANDHSQYTQSQFPYQNHIYFQEGIGLMACYDERHARYILTKRDYKWTQRLIDNFIREEGNNWFNTTGAIVTPDIGNVIYGSQYFPYNNIFRLITSIGAGLPVTTPLGFSDKDYFEDKSWTTSYSFITDEWKSMHSYIPNWLYGDNNDFLSYKIGIDKTVYKHNHGQFQTYYGVKHDYIVEYVIPTNLVEEYLYNINYYSQVQVYDPNNKEWSDILHTTFDKLVAYNSNQSTGLVNIIVQDTANPYQATIYDPTRVLAEKVDNHWQVNQLWDKAINPQQPLFTNGWNQPNYQGNYYIDKVVNDTTWTTLSTPPQTINSNINLQLNQYEQTRLKDYYTIVRLFFSPTQDYKIITEFIQPLKEENLR